MSIQQNFPAISPSLNLNFARSKTLDPRITFSRTSTATRVNEQGLIEVVSADIPRFDHKYENGVIKSLGLLVEESRQNLWNNSNDFTVWTKQTNNSGVVGIAITNSTTSPDGTLNACRYFVQTAGGTFYSLYRGLAGISSNTSYCYSVFAKAGEISNLGLVVFDNTGTAGVGFNLSTGTVGVPYNNANTTVGAGTTITNYGNGWYRCSIVFSSTLSGNNFQFKIDLSTTTVNQGIFIYGAQFEQGAFPTSYIPTLGSTATRNPDNVSMTGDNFSDWYNQSEGTVYCNAIPNATIGIARILWSISNNTFNNSNYVTMPEASGNINFQQFNNGSNQTVITISELNPIQAIKYKSAYVIKQNDRQLALNGVLSSQNTTSTPPIVDRMYIGSSWSGSGNYFGGHISQLTYYPRRLTNDQLQNLTK